MSPLRAKTYPYLNVLYSTVSVHLSQYNVSVGVLAVLKYARGFGRQALERQKQRCLSESSVPSSVVASVVGIL